jgi:hypothetical protein
MVLRCRNLPRPPELGAVNPDAVHDHANRRVSATIAFFIPRGQRPLFERKLL